LANQSRGASRRGIRKYRLAAEQNTFYNFLIARATEIFFQLRKRVFCSALL
jgi:hypothetical protein